MKIFVANVNNVRYVCTVKNGSIFIYVDGFKYPVFNMLGKLQCPKTLPLGITKMLRDNYEKIVAELKK